MSSYLKDFGLIKEVLQSVSSVTGTEAICAGGAPRDLVLGLNIRDFDIYIKAPTLIGNTLEDFILPAVQQEFINMFGKEVSDPELIGESWYEDTYIESIYEFDILEQVVIQLIFVKPSWDLKTVVKNFPMTLSQAWITSDSMKINTTPLFDKSIELRVGVYNHKCRSSYLSKIVQKFRGFAMLPINHSLCEHYFTEEMRKPMEIPF
jgi:hypothetical protein